jgi:putative ABC transport system permease protein
VRWVPDRYRELRSLLRPERLLDDVDEELAFHVEQSVADLVEAGMSAAAAREEALRRFGDVARCRAETFAIDESLLKERKRMELVDAVRRETRHTFRSLMRAPVFTVVAVLTLGLGMGATTAIWSLIDSVVLRPLPFAQPDRLVQLRHAVPGISEHDLWGSSVASYFHYVDNNRSLESLGAFSTGVYTLSRDEGAERLTGAAVTPSLFETLGLRAVRGRLFGDDDMVEGAPSVAVLSHSTWNAWFNADPAIVGSTVQMNSQPVTVIGVLEPGVHVPVPGHETHIWRPLRLDRSQPPVNSHWVGVYGRMRPGVTAEAAQADIQRLTSQLEEAFPGAYGGGFMETSGFRASVVPVRDVILAGIDRLLWMLLGAVGLVLLIACANVANLMLVRAEARRREQTVRATMGAERVHFALHYLTESTVLAAAAGVLGVFLAWAAVQLLVATAPVAIPRLSEVGLAPTTLLFALGLTVLTAVVFGLVPVLRARTDFSELRESGRGMTASRERQLVRAGLVVGQVGMALVLLAAGGLMLQSFINLRNVEAGFDARDVLTFQIFMPAARYPGAPELYAFEQDFMDRVRALPGIRSVSRTTALPLSGGGGCSYTVWEGMSLPPGGEPPCLGTHFIMPDYFETMRIPVRGETFDRLGVETRQGGVVVSQALADRLWPGEDPIGKGIISYQDGPPWYRVIGVAGDVRHAGLDVAPVEAVYYPPLAIEGAQQIGPFRGPTFVVRTAGGDPLQLHEPIRRLLVAMDPEVPLANPRAMEEVLMTSPAMARTTFTMTLLGVAAVMALFLSAVGLYGVIAYLVGRRSAEIGVRMALGARVSQIARLVVVQSLRMTLLGIAFGAAGAMLVTGLLDSLLFEVSPADVRVLLGVSVILLATAAVASALPARRAARTDPAQALRGD